MFPAGENKTDEVPVLRTCILQWEREQINKLAEEYEEFPHGSVTKSDREAASLERMAREDLAEEVTLELRPEGENGYGESIPDRRRSRSKVGTSTGRPSKRRMASMAGSRECRRWS